MVFLSHSPFAELSMFYEPLLLLKGIDFTGHVIFPGDFSDGIGGWSSDAEAAGLAALAQRGS